MTARGREIELVALAMFAAVPLYATQVISPPPLLAFHVAMAAILIRLAKGKSARLLPTLLMHVAGVLYILFYIVDAALISHSAIAASTHLVLFIAVYQAMESAERRNEAQRLLTAGLLFVASVATATHIAIVPFVIAFTFLLFRQLIRLSHQESRIGAGSLVAEPPSSRAAAFYLCGTTIIGSLLFPMLPRVRNPILPGVAGSLGNASTGLSDTINFNEQRTISADPSVVSRVWMGQEAIPFFTPLRLRGMVYERFHDNVWLQGRHDFNPIDTTGGVARIAKPSGLTRRATVQQRLIVGNRLFLPVGTYEVIGLPQVIEGPTDDIYMAWGSPRDIINYDVGLAWSTAPLRVHPVAVSNYPVTPAVAALAKKIVGNETDPMKQASAIESYMSTKFHYVPDPASLGMHMTVDDFLLKTHTGHCEYFAAGMVALLTALDVPARIVGGFYGGKLNPLTGYFVIRREDAHAWVEAYDGTVWRTFDPTPASMRPGNAQSGLIRAYASALDDSINYFWDRYILTFGLIDQIALAATLIDQARSMFGTTSHSARSAAAAMLTGRWFAAGIAAALLIAIVLWISWRRRSAFDLLCDHLRACGIEVGPAMTIEEALAALRTTRPEVAVALEPLIALYESERFSAHPTPARAVIRRRLHALSRA